jgi:hypothetical protein
MQLEIVVRASGSLVVGNTWVEIYAGENRKGQDSVERAWQLGASQTEDCG